MKKRFQSVRLGEREYKDLKSLCDYFNSGQTDICGAALSFMFNNSELIETSQNTKDFAEESFDKVCTGIASKIFKSFLYQGKTGTRIEIYKNNSIIKIAKDIPIEFVPPFIIDFEITANIQVSIDLSPYIDVKAYDEVNEVEIQDTDSILLKEDNNYIIKIYL